MQFATLYLLAWAASFAVAFPLGRRTGRRYDALMLTGILGLLGLLIFAAVLAADAQQPAQTRADAER